MSPRFFVYLYCIPIIFFSENLPVHPSAKNPTDTDCHQSHNCDGQLPGWVLRKQQRTEKSHAPASAGIADLLVYS